MIDRRHLLMGGVAMGTAFTGWRLFSGKASAAADTEFPFKLSEAEWRERLTPAQYRILRDHGTERAGTSPLNAEKRDGIFHCAGCDQALFDSKTKYESGTGWPSFYAPIEGAVGTAEDRSFFMTRTEVHCSNCGGHLGHVFEDGPKPTGLRYCMNGVAMTFKPASAGGAA
ncbi:peptide-methionine (R)-S-oxide reductase MsrB [Lutibaculum baratangense]|uniref:peptide-methionine (R)-S-oxide reductase n=1 Tax=Lutibaculum baratangense AMV1 TaxID=631454 RepID=V4RKW4_9HYPH|nr:peptide-methionine (R)-S-oxide reductase MsrB [Lutibaculum baratangense]ESR26706.1 Peptide methionine sulfoxide reductase MsrB [Lutibaculum baratangense AMV1]